MIFTTKFLYRHRVTALVIAFTISICSGAIAATIDDLYYQGQQALDDGNWKTAEQNFQELLDSVDPTALKDGSQRVDSSLYWLGYAQNKYGDAAAAVATLKRLIRDYPQSAWADDAQQLSNEIQGVTTTDTVLADDELQLAAISGLINAPAERVVPILQQILQSDRPQNQKERALFVLSQKPSPESNAIMAKLIADSSQPKLQAKAISMMALTGGKQALKTLADLYWDIDDINTRQSIIKAFGPGDAVEELAMIIKTETNPNLVLEAIKSIGIAGDEARPILMELYPEAMSDKSKRSAIVKALGIADGHREISTLLENMNENSDTEAIKELIKSLGIFGGSKTAMLSLYNKFSGREIKEEIINAVFIQDNAAGLIEIIKMENDPELKQEAVQKLSFMDSKEATDYLINLLQP